MRRGITIGMACLLLLMLPALARGAEKKHVLILNSYHKGYTWTDALVEGVERTLKNNVKNCEVRVEYMDTKRINTSRYLDAFFRLMRAKYSTVKFDVIIVSDDNAFQFALKHHRSLFGETPIVFLGVNNYEPSMLEGHEEYITGIVQYADIPATLKTALRLHPGAKQVAVISDATTTGRAYRKQAEEAESRLKDLKFVYLDGSELTTSEMLSRLRGLPDTSIALLCIWLKDRDGVFVPWETGYPAISQDSPVPVYGVLKPMLHYGIVGGKVQSGKHHGIAAAGIALRILRGEKVANIPVRRESPNKYMFDYYQLLRFKIPKESLPRGSIILNEPQSIYYQFKKTIWVIIGIFSFLVLVITLLGINIVRRKSAEESLRASEERYRSLVENIDLGITLIDTRNNIVMANAAKGRLFGRPAEEFVGKKCFEAYGRSEEICEHCPGTRAMSEGLPQEVEVETTGEHGSGFTLMIRAFPVFGPHGRVTGIIEVMEDITERKRAEKELEEHREILENILLASPVGIALAEDRVIKWANDAWKNIFGFEGEEDYLNKSTAIIYPDEEEYNQVGKILYGQLKGGMVPQMDIKLKRKDGSVFDGHIRLSSMDFTYPSRRVIATVSDVSWRKETEEALRSSQERFRDLYQESKQREELYESLLKSTPDAVTIYNLKGEVVYINPAFTRTFGFTMDDVGGRRIPFVPEKEMEKTQAGIQQVLGGEPVSGFETQRLTKDGRVLDIVLSSSCYYDHQGEPAGIVVILRDVTKAKQTEAQLLQAQKMEAIGTLAGGIAHDFNNLLQAIQGNADMLLLDKTKSDPDYKELREIFYAAARGGELTKRLLTFSRKVDSQLKPLDLNYEVKQVKKLLSRTIPKMIGIELGLADELRAVSADSAQIEQLLMNLAVNAMDAMPEGGRLSIETKNVSLDEKHPQTRFEVPPGEYVMLRVSDTGHGMDKETRENIFDPFYTTKEVGKGTGLGLAMVYGVVKNHGGYITCHSEPGEGTMFEVYLPAIETPGEPFEEKPLEEVEGGTETILLVDDEEFIRNLGERTLNRFGYRVLTAESGESALEIYQENRDEIDLVMLDLIMPGMGGRRCLEALLKIEPGIKVVIASGYSADSSAKEVVESGACGFVAKPFEVGKMLKTVREVLDLDRQ